jgi:hypothetical protein
LASHRKTLVSLRGYGKIRQDKKRPEILSFDMEFYKLKTPERKPSRLLKTYPKRVAVGKPLYYSVRIVPLHLLQERINQANKDYLDVMQAIGEGYTYPHNLHFDQNIRLVLDLLYKELARRA